MFGQGLNSLRIRFSLLVGVLTGIFFSVLCVYMIFLRTLSALTVWHFVLPASLCVLSVLITYRMTGGLTRPIEQLKASTDALASGDFETEVAVDCKCEVGGLADSFRKMVQRLNSNISKINTLAYEDGITHLPNRTVLENLILEMQDEPGALLFIDLDRFKQVNDTLGHESGDLLLRKAAQRILVDALGVDNAGPANENMAAKYDTKAIAPGNNMLFRFAGDEFIALIPGEKSRADLALIASSIITALERPFMLKENMVRISASIGISILNEFPGTAADCLKYADLAMYSAKEAGRAQYAFFTDEMRKGALENQTLENELRAGIETGQLTVHYQPKIDTRSHDIVGLEALVRWNHPERGLLFPGSFMKIAESCGLVEKIGREVVKNVARQSAFWAQRGISYRISINVCPSQFLNQNFANDSLGYFRMLGLSPDQIELELTESIAMADPAAAAEQLAILRREGVMISIDDFGTGYSNLTQLCKLPFDAIKIDRSLVQGIGEDPKSECIIESVVRMAHGLGYKVVAEGVETQPQLRFLNSIGCDQIQGFYFARAMDPAELAIWEAGRSRNVARTA